MKSITPQKIPVSAKLNPIAYRHAKSKPNLSRYVEALIIQDMQMSQREPIYEAITSKMLRDPEFLVRLAKSLSMNSTKPLVSDAVDLNPDWGA